MNKLGKIIELDSETRALYSKYDFRYFLSVMHRPNEGNAEQIQQIKAEYLKELARLKKQIKDNKRQALFFIEGNIRKCHSGGFLPSLFNLDESRGGIGLLDSEEIGKTWAHFDIWSKHERKKIFKEAFWDVTIKIGAILGFVSTAIQVIQVMN